MDSIDLLNHSVLFFGLVGIGFAVWWAISAMIEFVSLTLLALNGALKITAVTSMAKALLLMTAQIVITLVGQSLILNHNRQTIGLVAWSVVSVLLTFVCLVDQYRRHKHHEILERERHKAISHGARRSEDSLHSKGELNHA